MPHTIETTWEVWTYDVWGNAEEGYNVNDRYCLQHAYPLTLAVVTNNPGTDRAFDSASPSDKQIREALGLVEDASITTDGDDLYIQVDASEDGYPLGELSCMSHESLSPIRAEG